MANNSSIVRVLGCGLDGKWSYGARNERRATYVRERCNK